MTAIHNGDPHSLMYVAPPPGKEAMNDSDTRGAQIGAREAEEALGRRTMMEVRMSLLRNCNLLFLV
ncbi:hypothetical protein PT974_03700 [Cladobotryum mycophilum]|uniref:Uncharacterized protein n=1 Tax=Cladobotryum mycophilum TaxID=491253 RepID=A0ABR0STE4_9HYPO